MKKDFLLNIEKNNLSHAYLITGNESGREEWIKLFIDYIKINSSDLFFLDNSDKIKIQEIRNLQHQVNLKPHSSKHKVAVIKNAQMLTPEASNAILKTLEEPPQNSILILSANREEELLPTVVSRTRKIKIHSHSILIVTTQEKEMINSLFGMSVKKKFDLAQDIQKREQAENFVDKLLIVLREKMLSGEALVALIKKTQSYKKFFKTNTNKRLILENLFLEFP